MFTAVTEAAATVKNRKKMVWYAMSARGQAYRDGNEERT